MGKELKPKIMNNSKIVIFIFSVLEVVEFPKNEKSDKN